MVLFPQGNDEFPGHGLLGLGAGTGAGGEEKAGIGVVAKLVTEDTEGARGVTEVAGRLLGREALDVESPERLVLTLFGVSGTEEKVLGSC